MKCEAPNYDFTFHTASARFHRCLDVLTACAVTEKATTMNKQEKEGTKRSPHPARGDEQPLLRALVSEATRRGDSLVKLAKHLGVTYERLAQWRRNAGLICNAHRDVHENAARYLRWPTVLVLSMAGTVGLQDFVWPSQDTLDNRVARDLERLRQDPYLGGFMPAELAAAAPAVKLFVAFLFHELTTDPADTKHSYRWIRALQQAVAGNVDGQATRSHTAKQEPHIF